MIIISKIGKFLSWTISISSMIGAIFLGINFLFNSFIEIGLNVSENSIIYDLLFIDYILFYKIAFITFVTTFAVAGVVAYISMYFFPEEITHKILVFMLKFASVASIIIPMLFVLTKEQFNVMTTVVSFLALFSFVIPKEKLKKSIEQSMKKTNKNNPTENDD